MFNINKQLNGKSPGKIFFFTLELVNWNTKNRGVYWTPHTKALKMYCSEDEDVQFVSKAQYLSAALNKIE